MENKVTLTMKEKHKLKMVIDYEAGKVRATISSSPALCPGKYRDLFCPTSRHSIAAANPVDKSQSQGYTKLVRLVI